MWSARWRLACLWVSQTARVLADWTLRMFVILLISSSVANGTHFAWHLVTAVFITPFILLSPFNGAISNCLPKGRVLMGSAGYCALVAMCFATILPPDDDWRLWCACLGLMALGAAVYSPARYALLPAAAQDAHIPLTRVNGWIELGGAAAVIGGMVLGLELGKHYLNPEWKTRFFAGAGLTFDVIGVLLLTAFLNLLAGLTAWPTSFPSDVRRPEAPAEAVPGFFRDGGRILRDPEARGTLLGLAGFLGLITAGSGAVVAHVLGPIITDHLDQLREALIHVSLGAVLGCGLASLQGHSRRALGLVPPAATGLLAILAWAALSGDLHWLPCLLLGIMGGLANVPLRAAYQALVPADARGNAMAVMNLAVYVATTLLAGVLAILALPPAVQLGLLAVLAGAGAAASWYVLFLPFLELLAEVLLWPAWRIRAHGPGLPCFPVRGPLVVIANHSAWMDPLWLMKVLPRRLTPMMTSAFYDKPGLYWLMKLAGVIRVPAAGFRRETPELDEAVAVLDQGGCVLIFPEGWLKRDECPLLRNFGQGVWHILHRRPRTPVVSCWIEGAWGSFTSYKNGPPMTRKPIDWWRRIDVAVREPEVLDPSVLGDQRATRTYLMTTCLKARAMLGLPPVEQPAEAPAMAEDDKDDREPA